MLPRRRDVVGVRRVSFAAPAVPDLPGILRSSVEDGRVHLLTTDSDRLVTELVRAGTTFADLEVRPTSLEEAFITITSKEDARVQPHPHPPPLPVPGAAARRRHLGLPPGRGPPLLLIRRPVSLITATSKNQLNK